MGENSNSQQSCFRSMAIVKTKQAWRLGWGTPARLSYPLKITFIGLLNLHSSFLRTSLSSFSSNINVSSDKRPESNSISAILLLTFVLRLRASISERDFMQRACANTKQNTKYRTRRQVQHIHKSVQQEQNTQNTEARAFIVQQCYSFSTTEL